VKFVVLLYNQVQQNFMIAEFYKKIEAYFKAFDKTKIQSAIDYADECYKDGDNSLEEVFKILNVILPLKPDEDTIIAVILNELYIMESLSSEKIKKMFGPQVYNILNSLKMLSVLNYAENDKSSQVEVLRKMFITLAKDVRVILIWLACRLKNMRDLKEKSDKDEAFKLAKETMDVYVPIASRLGFYRMKTELEDLSFRYLNHSEFEHISEEVAEFGESSKKIMDFVTKQVKEFLELAGIEAEVFGRIKSVYSIYKKLKKKGLSSVRELYDFFAIRVVLPAGGDVDNIYGVLGLLHSEWKPLSNRFKDYVAVPKPNGYRSLHTVLLGLGPKGVDKLVEIQIRNEEMNREAEYGFASHWIYKNSFAPQVEWVKGLQNLHEFFDTNSDVLQEIELDIFKDRIFVLTPRGEIKDLPATATVLDFAYSVHTEVGHKCVMAKVNSNIVSLDYELANGDVVEIITKKESSPKVKWLSIVKSNFAKSKIKVWFNSANRDSNIKSGRGLLNAQLERLNKPILDQNYSVLKGFAGQNLSLSKRENLVEEVGKGGKLASDVLRKVFPYEKNLATKNTEIRRNKKNKIQGDLGDLHDQVIVGGETGLAIKLANCCNPRKNSNIVGYVTRGNRVSIHKDDCRLLDSLNGERIIIAKWKGQVIVEGEVEIGLKLLVASRVGLMSDITKIISQFGIYIVDIRIEKAKDGLHENYFLLHLDDLDKFDAFLDKLEDIEGVLKVTRQDKFR
jgi:GTP diphosphokinase / guanosine-3',5'-bis(diphosphate) 3'-diphosphatase